MNDIKILRAKEAELKDILELLEVVGLPIDGVSNHLGNFLVFKHNEKVIGCVGLEIYGNVGLLRSLAVYPRCQGKGIGKILIQSVLTHAQEKRLDELYLLTTTADKFFLKYGFAQIPRKKADHKVNKSIEFKSACPKTAICMKKVL
jgi:amino-acid N-acetyltransferase